MVSLYVDGTKKLFSTNATTVGDVLARSNVTIGKNDLVEPSIQTKLNSGQFNINVFRARPVVIVDGQDTYHVLSAYQSPQLLAQAAGLTVYPEDTYKTSVITNFVRSGSLGEQIVITRAKPMSILVDGAIRNIRTQATTVGAAISSADIALGAKDTVSVPQSTPVTPGLTITITRVTEAIVTLTTPIPFQTQTVTDPNLMKGTTQIKTPGANGQTTETFLIHYENGVETGRQPLQLVSQAQPVTQVQVVGTKVLFEGSVEYWRPMVIAAAEANGLDPNTMLRIMQCESNGNAADISTFVVDGQHPEGLFQYLPSTWIAAGGTMSNILDGPTQIQITAKKMATQGTGAWACQ
jgi:resuscitation-promoting factor RpfB